MVIYPAIDLYEGKVVRLTRGEFDKETVYSKYPAKQAQAWADGGADWIHVVDLEGAKTGEMKNRASLRKIRKQVSCKIQFGGGLRTMEDIEGVLGDGIQRVVVGTKALDEDFFRKVLERFGKRIAVSLDARDGVVQTQGWLKESGQRVQDVLKRFHDFPLETIIYTDIKKDGMLGSPNFAGLEEIISWTNADVILSGGVGSLEDIRACSQIDHATFEGVIVGKALYDKRFTLEEALEIVKSAGGYKL